MCATIEMDSQAVSLVTGGNKNKREPEKSCEGRDGMISTQLWPRYIADLSTQPNGWGPEIIQYNTTPISSISFDLRSASRGALTKQAFNALLCYTLYLPFSSL